MKLDKKTIIIIGVAGIAGLLVGRGCSSSESSDPHAGQGHGDVPMKEAAIKFWTCSMHPQIQQPNAGQCPLCAMDLIPVMASDEEDPTGLRELKLSSTARALAEVETTAVERRFPTAEIRMVGKVDYDETGLAYLTARVAGRLDRLYVDYTGVKVKKGDHMVSIYSPELLAAQEELIQSVQAVKRMAGGNSSLIQGRAAETVNASREKLRLWGLTEEQILSIEEKGTAVDHLTIYAPVSGTVIHKNPLEGDYVQTGTRIYTIADLSKVWVMLDAYESDLSWIHYGQEVTFETEAFPGQPFNGTIAFIDPVLNQKTRTVKVRVNVDNEAGQLKPGMFVRATVKSNIASAGRIMHPDLAGKWIGPMHPEIVKDGPGECDICGMPLVPTEEFGYLPADVNPAEAPLVIPVTAALITGKRAVVYVETNEEENRFEGREIVLGPRAGNVYLVRRGLQEGERVVTKGAFKLDAELQINAKPSMMTPEGGGGGGGHNHGGASPAKAEGMDADESMEGMKLSPLTTSELHQVLAAATAVHPAVASEDLGNIRLAYADLLERVDAVSAQLIKGHFALLWKEYAMLIGNDGQQGREVNSISEAKQVAALLREHTASMQKKMGLEHGAGHAMPTKPAVDPAFLTQLDGVVQAYLAMQEALAKDDVSVAGQAGKDTLSALAQVDMGLVTGEDHMAWMELSSALDAALVRATAAEDIETLRKEFSPLSEQLMAALNRFGAPSSKLYQLRCPMALGGSGANWLQADQETRNPYFGASMLGCGTVQEGIGGR